MPARTMPPEMRKIVARIMLASLTLGLRDATFGNHTSSDGTCHNRREYRGKTVPACW